jgi:hypothetical protein
LSSAGQYAPGEIAGQLAALAQAGASGVLKITGHPGGVIHLAHGYMAFAESRIVPDIGSRLVNSGQLPERHWSDLLEASEPADCEGCQLLRRGLITAGEMKELLVSVTLDALLAMAVQTAGGPPADISFVPQTPHWAGSVLRMETGSAWTYAIRVGDRLASHEIRYQARPWLCNPGRPWPAASPAEVTVADQIDGRATVRDLAWRNGLALHDTVEWIARLIEQGLCAITAPPGNVSTAGVAPPGPSRHAQTLRDRRDAQPQWATPNMDVLRRVLNGLKRLNVTSPATGGSRH